jgi:hypothetical protein
MTGQDRVFGTFAKQIDEQDFPISSPAMLLRMLLKHKTPALQADQHCKRGQELSS